MFILHLVGEGNGCSYTIACNEKLVEAPENAEKLEDALDWARETILEHRAIEIETAMLYEVKEVIPVDCLEIYAEQNEQEDEQRAVMDLVEAKRSFEAAKQRLEALTNPSPPVDPSQPQPSQLKPGWFRVVRDSRSLLAQILDAALFAGASRNDEKLVQLPSNLYEELREAAKAEDYIFREPQTLPFQIRDEGRQGPITCHVVRLGTQEDDVFFVKKG